MYLMGSEEENHASHNNTRAEGITDRTTLIATEKTMGNTGSHSGGGGTTTTTTITTTTTNAVDREMTTAASLPHDDNNDDDDGQPSVGEVILMEESTLRDGSVVTRTKKVSPFESVGNGSESLANNNTLALSRRRRQQQEHQEQEQGFGDNNSATPAAAAAASAAAPSSSPPPPKQWHCDEKEPSTAMKRSLDMPSTDTTTQSKQMRSKSMTQVATTGTEHSNDRAPPPTTVTAAATTDQGTKHLFMTDWDALGTEAISVTLVPDYAGVVGTNEGALWDHWPHWRVEKRRRVSRGWFDVQTAPLPFMTRAKRSELRRVHKELNGTVPSESCQATTDQQGPQKHGLYQVEISTAKSQTNDRLLGFLDDKLRFVGKRGDPRIAKGWFRKRFDIVSAIDGQSIEHKKQEFVQNILSGTEGKGFHTLSMRPFEKPLHLHPVPLSSDAEVTATDLESLDSVVDGESPCQGSTGSFTYNDDDDIIDYSSDDDSYEKLMKTRKASRPSRKSLLDDISSVASEDSEFVVNDEANDNDDDDFKAIVEGLEVQYQATAGKKLSHLSTTVKLPYAPPARKIPVATARFTSRPTINPAAAGPPKPNSYYGPQRPSGDVRNMPACAKSVGTRAYGQCNVSSHTQGHAAPVHVNGIAAGTTTAGAHNVRTHPLGQYPVPPYYQAHYGQIHVNRIHDGTTMGAQPGTSQLRPTYTAIIPVFPNGLRIRVWEMDGRLIFFGYVPEHPNPYTPEGFREVGDMIVGIEGHSVEHLKPKEVCAVIQRYSKGKHQLALQMRPKHCRQPPTQATHH